MRKQGATALVAVAITGMLLAGCDAAETGAADVKTPKPQATEVVDSRAEVPDVVGMTLDEASAALEAGGFTVETVGAAGEVESQAPSAGIKVEPGTSVVITVVDREAEAAAAAAAAAAEAARIGSVSQQNAYRSAVQYLDYSAFSRAGLIGQLTSEYGEGYPPEDAEFAVARLEAEGGVDWNAEAAESAASYLEYSAFSRQGLLDQLTSQYGEQFTPEQAEYGVSTTGL
ncbi:Ltp family lipoprotein [Cellulomonas sp. GbtcB1]|uniref:Ltp family lipoprotein n=1 Tax=Cellulomonas sp. GbtcB1 TaxID=2824746 RepID=UPI0020C70DD4|nr:Ltp family lipoprotein [Cellulomonas sp. GbtcB1]